jgi:hypothetical protein
MSCTRLGSLSTKKKIKKLKKKFMSWSSVRRAAGEQGNLSNLEL